MNNPQAIQKMFDDAMQAHRAGKLAEAEALYREVLDSNPRHADALHLLGMIAHNTRHLDEAARLIGEAIAIEPKAFAFHNSLGNVLKDQGQDEKAVAEYQSALKLNPDFADAHYNLGTVLQKQGKAEDAAARYRQAIAANPKLAVAHNNLGAILKSMGKIDEAEASLKQAIAIAPNLAEAHYSLGNILKDREQFDEAITAYQRAIGSGAKFADVYNNLGILLRNKGLLPQSLQLFEASITIDPNNVAAHMNRGMLHLLTGYFSQGWSDYEWRLRLPNFVEPNVPLWNNEDLNGKTILLRCEQGFGDNIQFIRYAKLVKNRGAAVWLACLKPLARLFTNVEGIDRIFAEGESLPPHDFQCHLLSLPWIFNTTEDTIPNTIPYLAPPADLTAAWAEKLRTYKGAKIGLVWAGNSGHNDAAARSVDRRRSLSLEQLAPLAAKQSGYFFSLQKGAAASQAQNPPPGMNIVDLMDDAKDFADTAALIANLDLVIGVDTAVVHVAGAVGKPVWVLSRFDGCWRWLTGRDDSPWYPTMRLFRQAQPDDWPPVIERVAAELNRLK